MNTQVLENIMKEKEVQFMLRQKILDYHEVFSVRGLLPGIVARAHQLCLLCLGYGLGATFNDDEQSALQYSVVFDYETPDWLRYLFIVDVLFELLEHSPQPHTIFLDEFIYE